MPDISRYELGEALQRYFSSRGAPAFDFGQTVLPAVVVQLDNSAFPPYLPVITNGILAAVAAQYGYLVVGLPESAPKESRLLLDRITIQAAATAVTTSIVSAAQVLATFGSLGPPMRTTSRVDQVFAVQGYGLTTATATGGNTATDLFATLSANALNTGVGTTMQLDISVILGPGWYYAIRSTSVNSAFDATVQGRLYQ